MPRPHVPCDEPSDVAHTNGSPPIMSHLERTGEHSKYTRPVISPWPLSLALKEPLSLLRGSHISLAKHSAPPSRYLAAKQASSAPHPPLWGFFAIVWQPEPTCRSADHCIGSNGPVRSFEADTGACGIYIGLSGGGGVPRWIE